MSEKAKTQTVHITLTTLVELPTHIDFESLDAHINELGQVEIRFYTTAPSPSEPWAFTVVASTDQAHKDDIAIIEGLTLDIDEDMGL